MAFILFFLTFLLESPCIMACVREVESYTPSFYGKHAVLGGLVLHRCIVLPKHFVKPKSLSFFYRTKTNIQQEKKEKKKATTIRSLFLFATVHLHSDCHDLTRPYTILPAATFHYRIRVVYTIRFSLSRWYNFSSHC